MRGEGEGGHGVGGGGGIVMFPEIVLATIFIFHSVRELKFTFLCGPLIGLSRPRPAKRTGTRSCAEAGIAPVVCTIEKAWQHSKFLDGWGRSGILVGFYWDVLLKFDPGMFEVWDASNQLRAELSLNLP
jgi:hypothetical protein